MAITIQVERTAIDYQVDDGGGCGRGHDEQRVSAGVQHDRAFIDIEGIGGEAALAEGQRTDTILHESTCTEAVGTGREVACSVIV